MDEKEIKLDEVSEEEVTDEELEDLVRDILYDKYMDENDLEKASIVAFGLDKIDDVDKTE